MKTSAKSVKTTKVAAKKASKPKKPVIATKKGKSSNANVLAKLQELIEENEETIHLILEIAAISIEKSDMSIRKKKISQAGLNFIAEILNMEDDHTASKSKPLLKK